VSFVTVSVAAAPVPAEVVKVTLKVNVPSDKLVTSISSITSVAVSIVPVPVIAVVSSLVSFIK
jgi:hypothetical protein